MKRLHIETVVAKAVSRRGFSALIALNIIVLSSLSLSGCKGSGQEFAYLYKDLPFEMGMVSRPQIPAREANLLDFGGNGNGTTLNTQAFADAIEYLSSKGGGRLVVPAGIYLTGPISLKSNIELNVTRNAVILFDPDRSLYPIIGTSFEGLDTRRCESPINAEGQHDIAITGGGVINGNGQAWRPVKKGKLTASQWKNLVAQGGVLNDKGDMHYPDEGYRYAESISAMNVPPQDLPDSTWEQIKSFLRPVMVSLRSCTNVLLEDCTFQNSPAWNIHPLMCHNLIVKNVTVRNPWYAQNGDGIDIESCSDVVLVDSSFDVGDDGICIKSGKDADGRRRGVPTKGLIVSGCTVYHGHGGFVVGSEMSGGVQNVKVSDCRFLGTDVGLRFKSTRGRGGVVSNIWISDIYMTDIVTETLLFDLFYGGKSAVEALEDGDAPVVEMLPVDETTPCFRDINITRVVCNGAGRAMYFNGLPEMPVTGVNVSDCIVKSKTGVQVCQADSVRFTNVTIVPDSGDPIITANVTNLVIE